MMNIFPLILYWITGHHRYLPEIKWSKNSWTHNIFRVYELIFWRRQGLRIESRTEAWKDLDGSSGCRHEFYTWEALIAYTETVIRKYLINFSSLKFVWVPLPQFIPANIMWRQNAQIPIAYLALAFDAVTSAVDENASSLTYSHTNTGSNVVLVVGTGVNLNANITGVDYVSGTAMTIVNTANAANGRQAKLWYKDSPATGANSVIVTSSAVARIYSGAVSLTGAAASSLGVTATATGTSTTPSVTTATTQQANSWVIDSMVHADTNPTVGAGQTKRYNVGAAYNNAGSTETTTTVAAVTMSWTVTPSDDWGIVAGEFKELVSTTKATNILLMGIGT